MPSARSPALCRYSKRRSSNVNNCATSSQTTISAAHLKLPLLRQEHHLNNYCGFDIIYYNRGSENYLNAYSDITKLTHFRNFRPSITPRESVKSSCTVAPVSRAVRFLTFLFSDTSYPSFV